jgi:HAD superfamily hydrolase (TIGR01509 family)
MKTILVDAVDAFIVEAAEGFCILEPLQQMLDSFPNAKIILTGANDEQFVRFGLTEMPYKVFTLKHNPEKTEPEYYQKMLAHFSLAVQDVVYFEHNPEAVKSAQSVGIKTYLWDNETRPVSELQKFLEENL